MAVIVCGIMPADWCCSTASPRPARAGRRSSAALGGRYRAVAPDLPGHGAAPSGGRPRSPRAPRTCARSAASVRARRLLDGRADRARRWRWRCRPGAAARAGRREPGARGRRPSARRAARADDGARRPHRGDRRSRRSRASGARRRCSRARRAGRGGRARGPAAQRAAGLAAALRGLGTGVMAPLWDRLGELAMPVTLVVGERDAKFRAIARADGGADPAAGRGRARRGPRGAARGAGACRGRRAPGGALNPWRPRGGGGSLAVRCSAPAAPGGVGGRS